MKKIVFKSMIFRLECAVNLLVERCNKTSKFIDFRLIGLPERSRLPGRSIVGAIAVLSFNRSFGLLGTAKMTAEDTKKIETCIQ